MEKKSMLNAVLCAIAMGLIGCLIYGALYFFNIIAAIGAYFIYFFAVKGYKKFNNNSIDKKGYAIVIGISVIELIITIFITLVISLMLAYDLGFGETINILFELISTDAEVSSSVIYDIVMSLIFLAVALLFDYVNAKKKAKMNSSVSVENVNGENTEVLSEELNVLSENSSKKIDDENKEVSNEEKTE